MTVNFEKATEAVELGSAFGVGYTVPRVNLLPPEIGQERALRRTKGLLALALVGVIAAAGAGYALAAASTARAEDELAVEQRRQTTLSQEAAKYDEVPRVLNQVEAAQTARSTAMSSDVLWYPYLNDLALTYPKNVWLDTLTMTLAGTDTTGAQASNPDPLATSGIGTVEFTGTSLQHSDVAAWLDVLAGTHGFVDPTFSTTQRTAIEETAVVDFTTRVVVSQDALSHRYDREAR